MGKVHADRLLRRMERDAISLSRASGYDYSPYLQPGQPRWKLTPRWIEFECGCVAERMNGRRFALAIENYDPVIFGDVPIEENMLALYFVVCHWHQAGMYEHRIKFSHRLGSNAGYADFNDWAKRRRPLLMGAS